MSGTKPMPSHSKDRGKLINLIGMLYNADIFKGIDPKELSMLYDGMDLQNCPAGTILYMPKDSCERIYIMRQGQVDIYKLTSSGKLPPNPWADKTLEKAWSRFKKGD